MKTLYELLGALPDDDAERIRAAYRRAAGANHPDNNPGDPDAPNRFRQIVHAYAILRDERQ
ncbi:DnaJ domain-containing protein, partial [Bradyrhizobium sp.]|uniref:DnaJ domain-containing protein n=1 Tax=Bradyrhizobium sp. TaxID=376 RepID=UPI003BAEFF0C